MFLTPTSSMHGARCRRSVSFATNILMLGLLQQVGSQSQNEHGWWRCSVRHSVFPCHLTTTSHCGARRPLLPLLYTFAGATDHSCPWQTGLHPLAHEDSCSATRTPVPSPLLYLLLLPLLLLSLHCTCTSFCVIAQQQILKALQPGLALHDMKMTTILPSETASPMQF